jgi:NodT family efflux transporter outer membrane factor (OMF) lipoprotein
MRTNYCRLIGTLLLFLSGCAKVSKGDLAHIREPIPLDRSIESALAREFFEEGGWPSDAWWEMFDDPQLNALVELSLEQSPTIQKAQALVAEAEQEARKERAALFPALSFDYEEQWQYFSKNGFIRSFYPTLPGGLKIPATDNQVDLSLNFNYEIDFFGRNRHLFHAALGKARAERAEAKQATLMLTTLVVQTYIELQTKLLQQEVLQEQRNLSEAQFALTDARKEEGLDPAIPVLTRESSLNGIDQSLLQIKKEIALDRHMLSILVGVGPDTDVAPNVMHALFEKPIALPSDLSSDLLARRPDLTAQIWRVESAAQEIGAAKADFYPRVNLMAFAQLEGLAFNQVFHIGSRQGGLVPAVHLPIFTGGRLTANLKEKVAAFNQETYRYNELLLSAAREVADEVTTLAATFDTLGIQIRSLEVAEAQSNLEYSKCLEGVSPFLNVLEKEEAVWTEHYALIGYERDYLLSVLKIVKALGGGFHANKLPKEVP